MQLNHELGVTSYIPDVGNMCDVTSEEIWEETTFGSEAAYGAVLIVNTSYGEPCDAINTETGRDYIVITKEILNQTLEFWKTLPEFKPSDMLKEVITCYKHK